MYRVNTTVSPEILEELKEIQIKWGARVNDLIYVAVLLSKKQPDLFQELLVEARRRRYASRQD